MAIQRLSDFQDAVQRELAWRKLEISALRTLASSSDPSANHVFRASQVLLCAHWEGFLKRTTTLYVEHVFAQSITIRELAPNVVAIAFFDDVMKAAECTYPGSEHHHIRLAQKIISSVDKSIGAPAWTVSMEGNPGSEVLERILKTVGLDVQLGMDNATWATMRVFINEQLVRDRHHVAHGEGLRISKESFLERAQRLLDLLNTVGEQFVDLAEKKAYHAVK